MDISKLEKKYQLTIRRLPVNKMFEFDKQYRAYLEKQIGSDPNNVQALIHLGVLSWEPFHEREKAVEFLSKTITLDSKNVEARFWLAKCYYHDFCAYAKSREALLEALEIDPNSPECLSLLASVIMDTTENVNEAISCYEKAIISAPDWPALYRALSQFYLDNNNLTKAESCIREGLKCKPLAAPPKNDIEDYFEKIVTERSGLDVEKKFERQIYEIRSLKKLEQDKFACVNILELEKAHQKAMLENANIIDLYELDAQYYFHLDNKLKENPNNVPALVLFGVLAWKAFCENERAVQCLVRAIALDPKNVEALFWLALCYYESFRGYDKSEQLLHEALKIEPNRPECFWLYVQLIKNAAEDANESIECLEKAIKFAPDWPSLRLLISGYYSQIGDFERADFHVKAGLKCESLKVQPKNSVERYFERAVTGRMISYRETFQELGQIIQEIRTEA
ncbi:MAG: tetratricopeptide repeat protein [Verrucomicrobia bacterium]|nr:tetratricopeptide repeat protein [Verrucomicrobiota bacterium]